MTAKIKSLVHGSDNSYKHKPRGVSDSSFAKVYWPYLPLVLLVGALLSFGGQTGLLHAASRNHHTRVLDYATSMSIGGLLADTNSTRVSNGVGGLSLNSKLNAAAQAQANDMAARNYWSHNTPEGDPPWIWVNAQGYSYQKLGQNLAAGFSDEQATINGWMASPPHKENLLDPAFTEVGFGFANNPNYTSAGGGPMTIVVAFYGQPQGGSAPVAAATPPASPPVAAPSPAPSPSSSSSSEPSNDTSAPAAAATQPTNGSSDVATPQSGIKIATKPIQAINTDNPVPKVTLAFRTSRAQVAFAHLPESSFATGFAITAALVAAGLWFSRHLFMLRKALVYSESYVIKHPLIDVGLITFAAISYMMSQTVGFIQ